MSLIGVIEIGKKPASMIVALNNTCRIAGEDMKQFSEQYKRLNDADKVWFRERFAVEYGWAF